MQGANSIIVPSKKIQINSLQQQEAKPLLEGQPKLPTVTYIKIEGNSYSLQFCEAFGEMLKSAKSITDLNMNDAFVSRLKEEIPKSIEFISRGLVGSGLLRLDISNNAVNPFGAESLLIYLQQAKSLQTLLIYNCGLGPMGVAKIAQGLKGTPQLRSFSIGRNRMQNEGILSISRHLEYVPMLEELFVYQNTLKEQGLRELLANLRKHCKNITSLDICDNFVRETATEELVLLLREARNLRNLNLSDCLNEDQNKAVVEGFQTSENRYWERLGYNFAELDTELALELLNILKTCPLKRLDITGNDFKKKVKNAYREAFPEEGVLSSFDDDDEEEVPRLFEEPKI